MSVSTVNGRTRRRVEWCGWPSTQVMVSGQRRWWVWMALAQKIWLGSENDVGCLKKNGEDLQEDNCWGERRRA